MKTKAVLPFLVVCFSGRNHVISLHFDTLTVPFEVQLVYDECMRYFSVAFRNGG